MRELTTKLMPSKVLDGAVLKRQHRKATIFMKRHPFGVEPGYRFPGTRLTVVKFVGVKPHLSGSQPMPVRPTFLVRCDCAVEHPEWPGYGEFETWLKPITWSHQLKECFGCHQKRHDPARPDCKECRAIWCGETL
jgi:hypothetical protein